MSFRLFVGNLPYDSDETEVKEFFSQAGQVTHISIPVDRETGKRRGFAFIEFAEKDQADAAIRTINNQAFKGRTLIVNEARARESRPAGPPSMRPSSGFRGSPSPGGLSHFKDDSLALGAPERGQRRNRKFGPDAKPGRGREPWNRKTKAEGGKRGPIPVRRGGQFFGTDDDYELDEEEDMSDLDTPNEVEDLD